VAKTVFDKAAFEAEEPAPQGATFLERALDRALGRLDGDASLSEALRQAAKAALAAALAAEIRDVLGAAKPGPAKAGPLRAVPPARPFAARPGAGKPGYFREPSLAVGISEAAQSEGGGREIHMTGGTATWLRVMPAWETGRTWTPAALKTAMKKPGSAVLPIFADAGGAAALSAPDGFGICAVSPGEAESSGVVFAFASGEVWALDTYVQDALSEQQPNPAILTFERQLTAAFEAYVGLLQRLGAPGPYRWVVGMDGLAGRSMAMDSDVTGLVRGDCVLNTVEVAGEHEGGAPIETALQPFFDELCRACSTPVG
jgi:hypothetical protein